MNNKHVIALGLNPAYQKTLFFERLNQGEVNRASRSTLMASGKGINFCRASRAWGRDALLLQFLGGDTGRFIDSALEAEGLRHITVASLPPTRTCTTCLCADSGEMTELIEPSGEISAEELNALLTALKQEIPASSGVALCGTVPPGVGTVAYENAVDLAKQHGIPILLDSWKDVDTVLKKGVDILKINKEELSVLCATGDLKAALKKCLAEYAPGIIAITDGPGQAWLCADGKLFSLEVPRLDKVINPIGAGDTVSAVMFAEFLKNSSPAEAFATGLAAASASCMTETAAVFDIDTARKLKSGIKISSVDF